MAGTAVSISKASAAEQAHVIVIENVQFNPQSLTIKRGARVKWTNKDLFPHSATSTAQAFDSKAIAPTAAWTWIAHEPGIYTYICTFHPTMKGTITVQ
jgi:plastocyanin